MIDLSSPTLGLSLGGGGTLGGAHVGVLQVLHERGIRPSLIAGTSSDVIVITPRLRGRTWWQPRDLAGVVAAGRAAAEAALPG